MRRSPAPSPHRLIYDAEVHVLIPAHGSTLVPLQQNISKGIVVTVKETSNVVFNVKRQNRTQDNESSGA